MQRLIKCFFEFWGGSALPSCFITYEQTYFCPCPLWILSREVRRACLQGPERLGYLKSQTFEAQKKTSLPFWISIRPTPRLSGRAPRGGNWGDPEKKEPIGGRSRAKRGGVADFGATNRTFGNDPARPTLMAGTWCTKTKYPFPPKESTFSGDPARS